LRSSDGVDDFMLVSSVDDVDAARGLGTGRDVGRATSRLSSVAVYINDSFTSSRSSSPPLPRRRLSAIDTYTSSLAHRQTDRHTDVQTDSEIDRQTDSHRQRDRHKDRQIDVQIQTDRETDWQTDVQTQTGRQTDTETDRQMYRQRQAERHRDRQTKR